MNRKNQSIEFRAVEAALVILCFAVLSGCGASPKIRGLSVGQDINSARVVRLEVPVESSSLLDRTSVGTGFMLAPRIGVTAAHVFNQRLAYQPSRAAIAGRTYSIELVGQDMASDVAVFRLLSEEAAYEVLDHAYEIPDPGQQVFVLGFPLPDIVQDHQSSMTGGIVSAVDRTIELEGERHEGLIQLDAVASYGNSGGPVLNTDGQVIGMLLLAASGPQGEWRGAAFALPIRRVARIAESILDRAESDRPPVLE